MRISGRRFPLVALSTSSRRTISAQGRVNLNEPPKAVLQIKYWQEPRSNAETTSTLQLSNRTTTTCPSPLMPVLGNVHFSTFLMSWRRADCPFPRYCRKRWYSADGSRKQRSTSRGGRLAVSLPHGPIRKLLVRSEADS